MDGRGLSTAPLDISGCPQAVQISITVVEVDSGKGHA